MPVQRLPKSPTKRRASSSSRRATIPTEQPADSSAITLTHRLGPGAALVPIALPAADDLDPAVSGGKLRADDSLVMVSARRQRELGDLAARGKRDLEKRRELGPLGASAREEARRGNWRAMAQELDAKLNPADPVKVRAGIIFERLRARRVDIAERTVVDYLYELHAKSPRKKSSR